MTLRIDTIATANTTVIRLTGTLRREHLGLVAKQIRSCTGKLTIDLGELRTISAEGVHFLNDCEAQGIAITNASPYITTWMERERTPTGDDSC